MNKSFDAKRIAELSIFIAILFVMRLTGLSRIPVGPFVMTLTMVPIAIGAMMLGPLGGAILGFIYGCISLYDAMSGSSAMTAVLFQVSPFHGIVLCVVTRTLVGWLTGELFRLFKKLDGKRLWCYFAGGLAAPLLNTVLFMGYIVLVFYRTDYVQGMVEKLGATGPLMFVVLAVGVQGLIEWLTGCVVGGGVTKGLARALKRD